MRNAVTDLLAQHRPPGGALLPFLVLLVGPPQKVTADGRGFQLLQLFLLGPSDGEEPARTPFPE